MDIKPIPTPEPEPTTAIPENLSQKIDDLVEQTTKEVELPAETLRALEDAAQAVAAAVQATEHVHGQDITASVIDAVRRKRMTSEQKKEAEKNKKFTKKWLTINKQPNKKGVGNATFEWKTGPKKGEKSGSQIKVQFGDKLSIKGIKLMVKPKDGSAYEYGAAEAGQDLAKLSPKERFQVAFDNFKDVGSPKDVLDLVASYEKAGKVKLASALTKTVAAMTAVADSAHEKWKDDYKKKNGDKPRVKTTKDEDWIKKNGTDQVDITKLKNSELPKDIAKENTASAVAAVQNVLITMQSKALNRAKTFPAEDMEAMASNIHDAWVERNKSWASDDLKKPYADLPEDEKEKDRVFIRDAAAALGFKQGGKTRKVKPEKNSAAASVISASQGAFDYDTLQQLVSMAIESNISDDGDNVYVFSNLVHGDLDVSAKVQEAARDYETAAEKLLEGTFEIARAEEAMAADAPYLMWMTQEGHGVGIHDGDLEGILDVEVLRKLLDTDSTIKAAHQSLADAIMESSFELLSDAYEEIVGNANDVYNTAVEAAVDAEKERDPSDYFPDGPGDSFAYQWNDVEQFVEKNLNSQYLEDVAEVCSKALAAGTSGDEIEKAMYDVGDYKFIPGIRAMKNVVVSTGSIGDVELFLNASEGVNNPFGKDITLKDVGEMMGTRLGSDISVKADFDAKEAASGEIKVISNIEGYVALIVDPKKLAAKLGVK